MLKQLMMINGLREDMAAVDMYIDEFLKTDMYSGVIAEVFDSVKNTRGKMIRPMLLLLSARFGSDYDRVRERLCRLGAMVEIVHMASLVHDDIIDDSPMRRGRITAQARFGKDVAVYAGDFMISRVIYHAAREDKTREDVLRVIAILGNTAEEMCRGEIGQKLSRWDTEMTIDTYLKNIRGKTVALFTAAAKIGAFESGCTQQDIDNLGGVGEKIGYLFQMRDDLLDIVSSQQQEAKPVQKDFSDGIYTIPVLYALGKEEYGGRLREIAKIDANADNYSRYLSEVSDIVHSSGGIRYARARIEDYASQAATQLTALPRRNATAAIEKLIGFLSSAGDVKKAPLI